MRGRVVRTTSTGPMVEVPDMGVDYAFGPCPVTTGLRVKAGDRVFVAIVGSVSEDVVVLGPIDPAPTDARTVVTWSGSAYPARPNVAYVEWVGPQEPTAGVPGDTWVEADV